MKGVVEQQQQQQMYDVSWSRLRAFYVRQIGAISAPSPLVGAYSLM